VLLLFQEVDVSRRDDAHQLAAHFSVVRDGDSTEAMTSFGLEDVSNALAGAHHHRVCDEALLIALVVEGSKEKRGREGMEDYRGVGGWCGTKVNIYTGSEFKSQRCREMEVNMRG